MKKDNNITSQVLSGLKGSDRDLMVTQLLASEILLKRLTELLNKEINDLDNISYEDFDSSSWAYKQAFKLGVRKGLQKAIKLFEVSYKKQLDRP